MEDLNRPLRIALFAEAVTLAHVARPISLAQAIAPAGHEILLACDSRYASFAANGPWRHAALHSIPSAQFNQALALGKPVYDTPTLQSYVDDDLRLIKEFQPDLIVGDFRLSLSVSARLAQVPYMAITNAYWTPHYEGGYELPVIPLSKMLPIPLASALFHTFRPLAFIPHCQPMNRLRARHNLPSLGHNLRRIYTDADHLLIPDLTELYPPSESERNSQCSRIGPLLWSPQTPPPPWWDEPDDSELGTIYVTMGSSGDTALLPQILSALSNLPVRVIASTAGNTPPQHPPANARLASYLPGDEATRRSRMVICNGGSLTTQQALASGVPTLGIASNMDQFLNMAPIQAVGAGMTLRADRLSVDLIRNSVETLLHSSNASATARRLQSAVSAATGQVSGVFHRAVKQLMRQHA